MTRRRLFALFTLYAAVVAGVGWVLRPVGQSFDSIAWKDDERIRRGDRLKMADDILSRRMLSGKSRSDVVAMLGQPPRTGYFSDWNLVYWLGAERGYMGIDSEWLVVRLDASQRVSDYRIVPD